MQKYEIDGQDEPESWATIYDFDPDLPQPRRQNNLIAEAQALYNKIQRNLLEADHGSLANRDARKF
ncbi:MAG: hypothetical protein M5U34_04520 [Chloroflexi bacterium]|nr:hypothetical protein [Chloroflexota bacterium]